VAPGTSGGRRGADDLELLAPDPAAFGGAGAAPSPDGPGSGVDAGFGDDAPVHGTRLAALAAVVLLVVVAVVSAAPWAGDEGAAPPTLPSTSAPAVAPPTTATSPLPVRSPPRGSGHLLSPVPDGFTLRRAASPTGAARVGRFELWATPGSNRTKGSWTAIQVVEGAGGVRALDARRVDIGGRAGAVRSSPDGVVEAQVAIDERRSVTVTAFGRSEDELVQLLGSVGEVDLPYALALTASVRGQVLVHASGHGAPSLAAQYVAEGARATARWERASDGAWLEVTSAPLTMDSEVLARFAVAGVPSLMLSGPSVRFDVGDLSVMTGALPDAAPAANVARWIEYGEEASEVVTLTSSLPADELLDLVPAVRRAGSDAWADAVQVAAAHGDGADQMLEIPQLIGRGTVRAGPWTASLHAGELVRVAVPGGAGALFTTAVLATSPVAVVALDDVSVVVARVPADLGAATLSVTTASGAGFAADLHLLHRPVPGSDGPREAAVVAVDELGPLQIALEDASGRVVATHAV